MQLAFSIKIKVYEITLDTTHSLSLPVRYDVYKLVVSHIPQFGDVASPVGDLLASRNFGICDTTRIKWKLRLSADNTVKREELILMKLTYID